MGTTLAERFEAKYTPIMDDRGCWEWLGSRNANGYGMLTLGARSEGIERAHRVSYELYNGPIPKGMFVLHSCDNPGCVNPKHLRVGTNSDNVQDMVRRGRSTYGRYNRIKTHCLQGHRYDEGNTYNRISGGRGCKQCRNEASKRYQLCQE